MTTTNTKISTAQLAILTSTLETAPNRILAVQEWTKSHEALLSKALIAKIGAKLEALVIDEDGRKSSLCVTDAGIFAANLDPSEYGDDPSKAKLMAGVTAKSYHDQYMAQGGGSGDNVDVTLRAVFMTKSREVQTKKGIRAEPALDTDAMKAWGQSIGLWNDRWDALNPGMRRMNLADRVRGAIRRGTKVELKGTELSIA